MAGIKNTSIHNALEELLGKPIAESSSLIIPAAIYPFPGGAGRAWRAITGAAESPLCGLGWKSLGVLELTALPSIADEAWIPTVQETDALLVWGGDPLYLAHWMRASRLADLLPSLRRETVYVGVSAGSMAASATFGETYPDPPRGSGEALTSEDIMFDTNSLVLVSALLLPTSIPRQALDYAFDYAKVLTPLALLSELDRVLNYPKLAPYITPAERSQFLAKLALEGTLTTITVQLAVVRDPKDSFVLELAVSGGANMIVSGDNDLLTLGRHDSIPIRTPAQFLREPNQP